MHDKMALTDPSHLAAQADARVVRLTEQDLPELVDLYARSYPGNWFEPQRLRTAQYCGWREAGRLVCVAGVHVYSPAYRAAALGNITTAPEFRGQGHARRVVAALCRQLLRDVDHIGLNVRSDNLPAIRCYQKLGFERCGQYEEYLVERR